MSILILICLLGYIWPTSGDDNSAYCFKFTWPGPMYTYNTTYMNCTSMKYKGVPCIDPIEKQFDLNQIWNNAVDKWVGKPDEIGPDANVCVLRDGYTCIKYTYIYNNAVLNSSHYCGKIIEDKTVAITSGCFYYEVDGHIIEVCACRSTPDAMPCNTATQNTSSILKLLTSLLVLLYNLSK